MAKQNWDDLNVKLSNPIRETLDELKFHEMTAVQVLIFITHYLFICK
jgi:hypothetical protein